MENRVTESDILDVLENNPMISQRKISEKTGISLGMVNILLKKCIKMGFLKVENLNSRTVKYILTPAGINEKTKKTLRYIRRSYKMILDISMKIDSLLEIHRKENKEIVLLGKDNEIMELLEKLLADKNIEYSKRLNVIDSNKKNEVIYLWDMECESEARDRKIEYVNIIKNEFER